MPDKDQVDYTTINWYEKWSEEVNQFPDFFDQESKCLFDANFPEGSWEVNTFDILTENIEFNGPAFQPPFIFYSYLEFIPEKFPLPETLSIPRKYINQICYAKLGDLFYRHTPTNPVDWYLVVISKIGVFSGASPCDFIRIVPAPLIASSDPLLKARYEQLRLMNVIDSGCETENEFIERFIELNQEFPYSELDDFDEEFLRNPGDTDL